MNNLFFYVVNKTSEEFSYLSNTINNYIYNSFGIIAIWLLFISIGISLYIFIMSLSYDWIKKKDEKKNFNYIMLFIRNYIMNSDLIKYIKQCSIYIILSMIVNSIIKAKLCELYETFTYMFYNCIPVTVLIILILFVINCIIFWKSYNAKISYFKMILNVNYFFLFLSISFGIQFIVMSLISILLNIQVLQLLKFMLESKKQLNSSIDLYETRKGQLADFNNTVELHKDNNYAIALNGEWGTGKTEFLKAFMQNYRNNNYYIYIEPMITDNIEGLIKQFSKQLTKIMKTCGVYLESSNTIEKYFMEILKLVQFNTKLSLDSFFSLGEKKDESYIDLKERIQQDIDELRGTNNEKRIVIIVDDFDRIDEEKQKTILHFIKEIVNFNGCITIFAFDYGKLEHNKIINHEYLEKFVSEEKTLTKLCYSELVKYHVSILDDFNSENQLVKKYISEIKHLIIEKSKAYDLLREEAMNPINTLGKGKTEQERKQYEEFVKAKNNNWLNKMDYLENSRRVINFCEGIIHTLKVIERKFDKYNKENNRMSSANIPGIIYFMNYFKFFDNEVYREIIKEKGIDEYWSILEQNKKDDTKQELENSVKLSYFNYILGDFIKQYTIDEEGLVIKRLQVQIVKDLFIDYNLEMDDIILDTETEIALKKIDRRLEENNFELFDDTIINSKDKLIKSLEEYQKNIFYNDSDEILLELRIRELAKYTFGMMTSKKISLYEFIKLIPSKRNYIKLKFIKYYLEPLINNELDKRQYKVTGDEKKVIESVLKYLEMDNVEEYKQVFIDYVLILKLNKENFHYEDIKKLLNDLQSSDELLEGIKKLLNNHNVEDFDKLHSYFNQNINENDNPIIAIDQLKEKYNEFLYNYHLIEKLKQKIIINEIKDKYRDLHEYWGIANNLSELKKLLYELSKIEQLDYNMTMCFHQAVSDINRIHQEKVDLSIKKYCEIIIKKIDKKFFFNEYGYIYLTIIVQRIISIL